MTANPSALNNFFILTIKGRLVVHFMDGQTMSGTFIAQDPFNIYVMVDEAPVMIPRSQIRFIQGQSGQPVEQDTLTESFRAKEPTEHSTAELKERPSDEDIRATVPEGQVVFSEDEGAFTYEEEEEEEDDEITYILKDTSEQSAPADAVIEPELAEDEDTFEVQEEEAQEQAVPHLVCTTGPYAGQAFALRSGVMTIGRSRDNDLCLQNDKEVSRRHAIIMREDDQFMIRDQNSLNGTFVNHERIEGPHYLEDGDVILCGVSTFEYHQD